MESDWASKDVFNWHQTAERRNDWHAIVDLDNFDLWLVFNMIPQFSGFVFAGGGTLTEIFLSYLIWEVCKECLDCWDVEL